MLFVLLASLSAAVAASKGGIGSIARRSSECESLDGGGNGYNGFSLQCGWQRSSEGTLDTIKTNNFTSCVEQCADDEKCKACSWSNYSKNCARFNTTKGTTKLSGYFDSAVRGSAPNYPNSCGDLESKVDPSTGLFGIYQLACNRQPVSAQTFHTITTAHFQGCLTQCTLEPLCKSVFFNKTDNSCAFRRSPRPDSRQYESGDYAYLADACITLSPEVTYRSLYTRCSQQLLFDDPADLTTKTATFEACADTCEESPTCQAFVTAHAET